MIPPRYLNFKKKGSLVGLPLFVAIEIKGPKGLEAFAQPAGFFLGTAFTLFKFLELLSAADGSFLLLPEPVRFGFSSFRPLAGGKHLGIFNTATQRDKTSSFGFGCLLALLGAFSGSSGSFDFKACVFLVLGIAQKPTEDCSGSGSQCGAFAAFV